VKRVPLRHIASYGDLGTGRDVHFFPSTVRGFII
jgi:hypothetical protein